MPRYKNVPVDVADAPDAEVEAVPADEIALSPELAWLAFRAYSLQSGAAADADDNQAERLVDGTIKMHIRQPDRSHKKIYLSIPESILFKLAPEVL